MTQIINFVLFINGLIFGNKNKNKDRKATFRNLIFCAILILSLFVNYWSIGRLWDTTASVLKYKERVADYELIVDERNDLLITNQVLYETLMQLGAIDKQKQQELKPNYKPTKPVPKKNPKPRDIPVIPNRDVVIDKPEPIENNDLIE